MLEKSLFERKEFQVVIETSEGLDPRAVVLLQDVRAIDGELERRKKAIVAIFRIKPRPFRGRRRIWKAQKAKTMKELAAWYNERPAVRALREFQAQCNHKPSSLVDAFWKGELQHCLICGKEIRPAGSD